MSSPYDEQRPGQVGAARPRQGPAPVRMAAAVLAAALAGAAGGYVGGRAQGGAEPRTPIPPAAAASGGGGAGAPGASGDVLAGLLPLDDRGRFVDPTKGIALTPGADWVPDTSAIWFVGVPRGDRGARVGWSLPDLADHPADERGLCTVQISFASATQAGITKDDLDAVVDGDASGERRMVGSVAVAYGESDGAAAGAPDDHTIRQIAVLGAGDDAYVTVAAACTGAHAWDERKAELRRAFAAIRYGSDI